MLKAPSVHRSVTTYGKGTLRVVRMKAAATSKAIGTGRNVPASATSTIPNKVTWVGMFCAGITSATHAPSNAARIMNGTVVSASCTRFLKYCLNVALLAGSYVCYNPVYYVCLVDVKSILVLDSISLYDLKPYIIKLTTYHF